MATIDDGFQLDFQDVLLKPKLSTGISSRREVRLERTYNWKYATGRDTAGFLMNSNTTTTGTSKMAVSMHAANQFSCIHKFHSYGYTTEVNAEPWRQYAFQTVGIKDRDELTLEYLRPEYIHIDVANGYIQPFYDFISKTRDLCRDSVILAGTVVTPEAAEKVIKAGADIVKIGLGNGSPCLTRPVTGVGYPQLSALLQCSGVIHSLGGYVLSDGGCSSTGDVAKALAAGADIVMLGGMLAGTTECHNPTKYYGMASAFARKKWETIVPEEYRPIEGAEITFDTLKGPVTPIIEEIKSALRSTITYSGFKCLEDFIGQGEFIRVNRIK